MSSPPGGRRISSRIQRLFEKEGASFPRLVKVKIFEQRSIATSFLFPVFHNPNKQNSSRPFSDPSHGFYRCKEQPTTTPPPNNHESSIWYLNESVASQRGFIKTLLNPTGPVTIVFTYNAPGIWSMETEWISKTKLERDPRGGLSGGNPSRRVVLWTDGGLEGSVGRSGWLGDPAQAKYSSDERAMASLFPDEWPENRRWRGSHSLKSSERMLARLSKRSEIVRSELSANIRSVILSISLIYHHV